MARLTDRGVAAWKAEEKRQQIADDLCRGLYLVVQPTGAKSWSVRYRTGEVQRRLTLGQYPAMTLAQARDSARKAMADAQAGRDPQGDKAEAKANTVGALLEQFIANRHRLGRRSADTVERMMRRELKDWLHRPASAITKREVRAVLEKAVERGSPATALRLRAHIGTMFNWAVATDRLAVNPAAGLPAPAAAGSRDRVLSDDELRAFWAACDDAGYPWGPCFRVIALTAQRRGEVGGMRWDEIDGDLWTIPAARAKNGQEHVVPLSAPVLDILATIPRRCDWVFTTNLRGPVRDFDNARRRLKVPASDLPWKLHDLRRTAATGMAAAGVQPHVVEAVLNHVGGFRSGVAGVYNRYAYLAEKREALAAWAAHVEGLVKGDS